MSGTTTPPVPLPGIGLAQAGVPLTDAEKGDIRFFCGYSLYGNSASGFMGYRFFQAQGFLEYRKANHFDTGDAFYDGAAANAFRARVRGMLQNFQGDQVKATVQDGVQQINTGLGDKVANGTLGPLDIAQATASLKTLAPLSQATAGPRVIAAVTGGAKTVAQMSGVLTTLNAPGSFGPGVSYAQQFPQAYAELNERFARQGQDVTTLAGAQAYDSIQNRIDTAKADNDGQALTGIMSDRNQVANQYGGAERQHMIQRQIAPLLHGSAVQTAQFNTIDAGVNNPAGQDPKLFTEKGDAYLAARGVNPLDASSPGPGLLSGTDSAARTVGSYNAIPPDMKQRMSLALNNGTAPDQQATAFSFYHQVAAAVGEANVLSLMNPEAQQTYQTVRDLSAGGANVAGIFSTLASNGKQEMKEVPETTIAGVTDPGAAKTAITAATNTAVNNAWNTNGIKMLDPITGASPATISPEVQSRIAAQIKTGAMAQANLGPMDLPTLAKQAVEREMPNMQTLPGVNGQPIVAYVPGMPTSLPDPKNPGQTVPVVQAGRAVLNPSTKQPEDTTATAITDLGALSKHMPDRFGTGGGLSLSATVGSYANRLTQATGVYTVLEGGMAGSPGQPVTFDGTKPITLTLPADAASKAATDTTAAGIANGGAAPLLPTQDRLPTQQVTLGADPVAAAKQLSDLWPNSPFVLVQHTTPQGPAYTLGYRFHFTGTDNRPTPAQRETAFVPNKNIPLNNAMGKIGTGF